MVHNGIFHIAASKYGVSIELIAQSCKVRLIRRTYRQFFMS